MQSRFGVLGEIRRPWPDSSYVPDRLAQRFAIARGRDAPASEVANTLVAIR
jgi:hypothetical protein